MKKSTLVMILCLVLAVALGVGGTLAYLTDTDADKNVMTVGRVSVVQNEQQRVEENGEFTDELEPFVNDKMLLPVTDRNGTTDNVTIGDHELELKDKYNNYIDKIVTATNTSNVDVYLRTFVALPTGIHEESNHWHEYDAAADVWLHWNLVDDVYTHYDLVEVTGGDFYITVDGVEYEVWQFTHKAPVAPEETTYPVIRGLFMDKRVDMDEEGYYITLDDGTVHRIGNFLDEDGKMNVLVLTQAVQADGFDSADSALTQAFPYGEDNANVEKWFTDWTEDDIGSPGNKNDTNNPPEFFPTTSWQKEGNPDTSWYNDTDTEFVIDTEEEFAGFAKLVNDGNTFNKKTVKLGADLDLSAHNWVPIGNSTMKFQGTFDGQGNTISNLIAIHEGVSNIGLFGMTTNGTVKNFTVDNATVTGYLNVGVVAGTPYTTKYSDITLTGLIRVDGFAYVGGLGGKNAYANIDNITINAKSGSYVKANSVDENGTAYRTYVGGVIGFMGEGGHKVTKVTSNINVYGSTIDVGGITGIAHYGNSFINCSSSGDVYITDATEAADVEEMGGIAGVWHNGGSNVTFDGCSFTGTLNANIAEGVDLSDNTIVGSAYSATGTGELIIK